MGRGHSGSTVLDALLGNARYIVSVGELVSGIDRNGEMCSCGAKLEECEFWRQVRRVYEQKSRIGWKQSAALLKPQAHITGLLKFMAARPGSREVETLMQVNKDLIVSVLEVSSKKCMVDSSKEVTRALFLLRFLPDIKIVHLVRNPDGILASDLHRLRNGAGFKFLRHRYIGVRFHFMFMMLSVINWVVGNLIAEIMGLVAPEKVMRIKYEDLCARFAQTIRKLSDFTGIDLETVVARVDAGERMPIGHNIGGNYMRKQGSFLFNANRQSRPLPRRYKIAARLIAWPSMLMHGYLLKGNTN
jgi:hypothetical protein